MSCRSEINRVDDRTSRMDLHCTNLKCITRSSHMGVLVRMNETWECLNYTFQVFRNGLKYQIKGAKKGNYRNYNVSNNSTTLSQMNAVTDAYLSGQSFGINYIYQYTYNNRFSNNLIETDFIEISTGNDMHIDLLNVVDRLITYSTNYEFLR